MSFRDYSLTPGANTELGDGTYIGPNMLRNKVRPALQQLAADGKALADEVALIPEVDISLSQAAASSAAAAARTAASAAGIAARAAAAANTGRPNDRAASVLGASMGFSQYLAIDYTTTNSANAVARRDSVIGNTDTTINAFFSITATYDSTTFAERVMLADSADGLAIDATDFTFTRPLVVYQRFYRDADVDNSSLYVANAGNTARLTVGTNAAAGTDTGVMTISAVTSTTTINAAGAGLDDDNGLGEKTLWEVAYLFTATRMAICINGEEVRTFDANTLNRTTTDPITLFTPALIAPANGTDMGLAATVIGQVDSNFGDDDLRRLCTHTSRNIVDLVTVQRYAELAASSSYMVRQPIITDVWETAESVDWTVKYWVNSVTTYAENPNEVRLRRFSCDKASGIITSATASEIFEQTVGWPASGSAISAPVTLAPTFGADKGKQIYVYDYPAGGPIVQRTSDDGGRVRTSRSAALAFPSGYTSLTPSGNGASYEVPADHATNPGRIYFPLYGNLGMRLGYRDSDGTFGSTGSVTGLPVGRFVSETNIAPLPNGDMVLFSRVGASWGGADIQDERIISTMAVGGSAPAYVATLDTGDGYLGVAGAAGLGQMDPEGRSGRLGALAFLRALNGGGSPVNHGSRLSVYGGTAYEELYAENVLSRWAVRRSHDLVPLTKWGRSYFLIAFESSLDQSNGNSSVYTGILNVEGLSLAW